MIKLYTLPTCYHCQQAKRKLKELNILFKEIDVDQDVADYLKTKTDQMSLPVIMFHKELDDVNNDEVVSLDEAIKRYEQENRLKG